MRTAIISLLIATLGYFCSGYFGLLLAIPPGFASAVWPASGVALFCMLRLHRPAVLVGIGLGSFALNLGVSSQWYTAVSWGATLPAFGIASGAILQALAGDFLFRRFIGKRRVIDSPKELFYFIFAICLGGCLVAATIGINTLYSLNIISQENFLFSWITWWAGDSIGVLLFTPLLLTVFSQNSRMTKARKLQISLPALIIFFGILVLFFQSSKHNSARIDAEIEERGQLFVQSISENFEISKNKLKSYGAFFDASNSVERDEFDSFSKIMLKQDQVFQGVGWTEIVSEQDRVVYEEKIRSDGFPEFSFTEITEKGNLITAAQRERYFPVLYIYPFESNRRAFGLNLGANKDRLNALVEAKAKSTAISTRPIILVQEKESQFGYILYLPVFKTSVGQPSDDKKFLGFISGVFRLEGLFGQEIVHAESRGDGIQIIDQDDPNNIVELYSSSENPIAGVAQKKYSVDFGGRTIQIKYYATKHLQLALRDWTSWTILTIGFSIVAMLQSFILIITGNSENTKRLVEEKTRDLLEAKKLAEEANSAKSEFTANMSHEIRTPLNAIIGFINQCLKTPLSSQQSDYLNKSKAASKTLLLLINQTLDYSKIDSGKLQIEQSEFTLYELLENIYIMFHSQIAEKNLNFNIELPDVVPNNLIGDSLRLKQVFINLTSNALKFTQQGGITIKVEVDVVDDRQADFTFVVSDTGIGLSDEQLEFMFESYQQADNSTTRKFGGTGLGLTICKHLMHLMGGEISAKSELGKGTEFTIGLRIALAQGCISLTREELSRAFNETQFELVDPFRSTAELNQLSSSVLQEQTSPQGKLANIRILLVEDIEMNRLLATEIVQEHGAIVTQACDGVEAVELLKNAPNFDVVLMDIQMPNMDGYEATRIIRNELLLKQLPILALTANALDSDVQKCLDNQMDGHISKPLDEELIVKKILELLEKPHRTFF